MLIQRGPQRGEAAHMCTCQSCRDGFSRAFCSTICNEIDNMSLKPWSQATNQREGDCVMHNQITTFYEVRLFTSKIPFWQKRWASMICWIFHVLHKKIQTHDALLSWVTLLSSCRFVMICPLEKVMWGQCIAYTQEATEGNAKDLLGRSNDLAVSQLHNLLQEWHRAQWEVRQKSDLSACTTSLTSRCLR